MTQKPSDASGPTRSPAGIDAREQEKHIKSLEFAGIGKRYQGITFESIERRGLPPDWDIRQNYKAVKAYADDIQQNVKRGYGLILAGNYGRGCNAALDERAGRRLPHGADVLAH